jgi:transcription antitermination factor NusG
MEWFALYVKSRHEFITNSELKKKGINTFLPSVKRWRQWKDRKKLIDFPLFPGYLFVHVYPHPEDFFNVLRTKGAINLVSSEAGYPTPVKSEEIDSLRLLIESGKELDIFPSLKEGTRVRVRRGPLKGAEGILRKKEDQYIFVVDLKLLGRSVGVRIYADDIESA